MRVLITIIILFFTLNSFAQDLTFKSIHQEQAEYYQNLGLTEVSAFDSLNNFSFSGKTWDSKNDTLAKRVFGYFPYWAGSNYLNYQWDLLSDFCFFSYEVDPNTGEALNLYDWDTSPAIDSAIANNVNVHLCVTLFTGHQSFFQNTEAQQTLISNIISLLQSRGAQGVNMDIEALPSSQGNAFTNFMIDLNEQMDEVLPNAEISIASPAVNWNGTFDIPVLNQNIDFFMVMAYDYYWNGSSQAGPVSPLYSMTEYYDYSFSKTISYYQAQGVQNEKLIIGVPYYVRQWPTANQYAPSATNGNGTAYTYRYVKSNSSGNYSSENLHLEPNSLAPYYSYLNNGWVQCFMDNVYSLGKKYDLVNRRNLAGIGIWALGYDDGYNDLWDLISDKFTTTAILVNADTIFDSGGPAFDYYNNEDYTYTITTAENSNVYLSFSYLNTEQGYDSLWIYDGPDTTNVLIGVFSGDSTPQLIAASGNTLTLKFQSDNGISSSGWRAVYDTLPVSSIGELLVLNKILVYPNPATDIVVISPRFVPSRDKLGTGSQGGNGGVIQIHNPAGYLLYEENISLPTPTITINTSHWNPGVYFISIYTKEELIGTGKLIVR